ncbi:aldehyde dehydrogenase family protein [Streptomyces sp. VRA16 Mangrove soil]|uniref:aldehyde dehydrogenase family protein n=1 Tax=Streptomyces sp. VRA16 Mangrove soil TaxID=2817434 RepID=UPI001A9F6B60|nr:aldehyde dehydrogenase family protein [Streptomyces sp. VRA16 Mangrove soil]MBO1333623.1 aldehyde dehydrogenase family protein [Streptomyces sp. VRA16 Mangrove soil]
MSAAPPALDTTPLDTAARELKEHAASWTATALPERIALLERMLPRIADGAAATVADAARAKGYAPDSGWAAEDWITAPYALAQTIGAYLHVLRRLAAGQPPVDAKAVRSHEGRTVVDVFPAVTADRLLLNGFKAEVWTLPGTTREQVLARAAGEYRGRPGESAVALVLGAGNVAAITPLDIVHKLYAEGQVVLAKMNPVNAYLRPHFEKVFTEFIEAGWVRFVDGGGAEGAYLTTHEDIDTIHVTGSDRTHDAIVWGTDEQAEERRRADTPVNTKPFTSELGGVSPCIVTPGPWSDADFRFQAEHIVTSKLNNSGHNCIATQVLVVPREWDGTEKLLAQIRTVLRALPPRPDYYPGAADRRATVTGAHADAEILGADDCRVLVPDITDPDDPMLKVEVFASALGVVRLPGADAPAFLRAATDFANDKLPGTLGATLLVHPKTERAHRAAVDEAVADLRYGTLGVNLWSAFGFLLGYTPWGAFPGHTRQDIGSGIGFVHNAFLLEDIEKTVVRAPFAPSPRGLFTGAPSLSPRPPYYVTNRTALTTMRRMTAYTADPKASRLPGIFASALRG